MANWVMRWLSATTLLCGKPFDRETTGKPLMSTGGIAATMPLSSLDGCPQRSRDISVGRTIEDHVEEDVEIWRFFFERRTTPSVPMATATIAVSFRQACVGPSRPAPARRHQGRRVAYGGAIAASWAVSHACRSSMSGPLCAW